MLKITFAIVLALCFVLPTRAAWAGSPGRRKPPPPLAKLVHQRIVLAKKIEFDSWQVQQRSHPLLKAVARIFREHRKLTVRIEVHSDSRGSAPFNRMRTQNLAEQLKKILVKMGVKAQRLKAVGRGEAYPIDSNRTREGRAKNRRIEFHVIPRKKRRPRP